MNADGKVYASRSVASAWFAALLALGGGCSAEQPAEEPLESGGATQAAPIPGGSAGTSTRGSATTNEFIDWGEQPSAGCEIGSQRSCACPSGATAGLQYCIGEGGEYSECGCPAAEATAFSPPQPIVVPPCGGVECAPYLEEDTQVGAKACCTTDNRCGSSSGFIFGAACVARGGDPGKPDPTCPNETPTFLDLKGCCRSDGQCGLSIDAVNNWDAGCIERTHMAQLVNDGSGERDLLALLTFVPSPKQSYAPIACTP